MTLSKILKTFRKVGLSSEEKEIVQITDEPKFHSFLCLPNSEAAQRYKTENSFGQGYDSNEISARLKSIGEYLERLSMENPDHSMFVLGKFGDRKDFIDPELFCSYSEEQVDRKDFIEESRNSSFKWYPVKKLNSEKEVYIPGQMIFLSSIFDDEFQIRGERITTGTALGIKRTKRAVESALLESIERDSCIGAYLLKRDVPKIINLPKSIEILDDYLERYLLKTSVFDVTSDLNVPSVLAITLDHTGIGAAVNVGSKSSFDHLDAVKGAIMESLQCRRLARITPIPLVDENKINSLDDRFFYWNSLERIEDLSFWLETDKTLDFNSFTVNQASFGNSLKLLNKRKYHVFVSDLTLPELKREGLEVLKVVVPELHPMYLNEKAKMLYSEHYGEIKDLGLKPHPLT